jgi:hypothetical protein
LVAFHCQLHSKKHAKYIDGECVVIYQTALKSLDFDGVRDALSNVRGKPADEPCVVPRTDFLVGIINVLKENFPSFDTSQVFVGSC